MVRPDRPLTTREGRTRAPRTTSPEGTTMHTTTHTLPALPVTVTVTDRGA